MLILTRRAGEAVTIGEGATAATVVVLGESDGTIKLGFDAPRDVPILRDNAKKRVRDHARNPA